MKNETDISTKVIIREIIAKVIPILIVGSIVFHVLDVFKRRNEKLNATRNEEYIKEFTLGVAEKLDFLFENSINTANSIARINAIPILQKDSQLDTLRKIEKEVQFDYACIVTEDGISHNTYGEVADVSDRDYFIRGMNGESAGTVINESRFTHGKQLCFFAPVELNGTVKGVAAFFFDEESIASHLVYYFYGEKSSVGLITREGKQIATSPSEVLVEFFDQKLPMELFTLVEEDPENNQNLQKMCTAIKNGGETNFVYKYDGKTTYGYVAPLEALPLSIYMTFPRDAVQRLNSSSFEIGIRLHFSLVIVFCIYVVYLIAYQLLRTNSEMKKNRMANYVIQAEKEVSRGLIYLDIEKMQYEDLSNTAMPIPKSGKIDILKHYLLSISETDEKIEEIHKFMDEEILKGDKLDYYPTLVMKRDERLGPELFYGMTYVPVNVDGEKIKKGVVLFRDVTNAQQKERDIQNKLITALNDAEQASRAKTIFLNNMSHDIRTPMNAIIGFANLMEEEKNNPAKVSDYLGKIKSSGEYLLSLINNVLDMARIESGAVKLEENFLDLYDSKRCSMDILSGVIKEKKLTFNVSINIIHQYVLLDIVRTNQIMMNLLNNAIKYTPDGGTITFSLQELSCPMEGYGTFETTVSDTGIGMSKEYVSHIFDSFSREHNTTESKVSGTGLGMAIVKKLVDLMGGVIEVESEKGKGTTFRVVLMHKLVQNPEDYLQKQEAIKNTEIDFSGKRVLLAEDNDLNAEIAEVILTGTGFLVDRAKDGVECYELFDASENNTYDLILMDVQMPNMDGYETTKKIRALPDKKKAGIPIVAMTANAFEEDRKLALSAGMSEHISKPIDVGELKVKLSAILQHNE